MTNSAKPTRQELRELADKGRFNEIIAILQANSKERTLELFELVTQSRVIQLGDNGPLPLEAASTSAQEALDRDPEYVPALIEMAYYLDAHDGEAAAAVDLFEKAADLVFEELLDVIRGWAEAKLLDDDARKEMLRSYNAFRQSLVTAGLHAGEPARKVGWVDESESP